MIEMRWKLGRANKGSPSVPKTLQYKVMLVRVLEPPKDGMMTMVWTGQWSGWMDVPSEYPATSKTTKANG